MYYSYEGVDHYGYYPLFNFKKFRKNKRRFITMKKVDVIAKLAEQRKMTKKEAGEIVEAVLDIIKTGIKEDGEVDFYGFCKFQKVHKDATTARSPQTGETVNVPEKDVPKCKFSSAFKKELA
nr:MAG TPA: DNA binding protein [Caudoviricetes sp.]